MTISSTFLLHFDAQDHDGLSALICAATMGQVEMVKRLIECEKVEVNLQVRSILLFTTFSKDNDERHTALIAAVNKNFVKVVDALMQHPKLDMNIRYMVDLARMTLSPGTGTGCPPTSWPRPEATTASSGSSPSLSSSSR